MLYYQYCLLNASFQSTLKQKQYWAIKINNIPGRIVLGVCLKSKMLSYNFNSQDVYLYESGHGFYMIRDCGYCFSHYQEDFNRFFICFEFGKDAVIYVEYDLVENKLRFSRNKEKTFELPIPTPPQDDAYCAFVGLRGQNFSVELLPSINCDE